MVEALLQLVGVPSAHTQGRRALALEVVEHMEKLAQQANNVQERLVAQGLWEAELNIARRQVAEKRGQHHE